MIQKVLIGFLIASVIIVGIVWLLTGGFRRVQVQAERLTNFVSVLFSGGATSSTTGFQLPWQPKGLSIEENLADLKAAEEKMGPLIDEEEPGQSQKEYDAYMQRMNSGKTLGDPSSHRGMVHLSEGGATQSGASEYLEIEAAYGNTAPISIAGWSLQSPLTGVRAYIPRGTNVFVLGDLNRQENISLNPDARAIVSSRASPIGTSFRENLCTGYLMSSQTFVPSLSRSCPPPSDALPLTPENLRTYGDACYDALQELPACTFPLSLPSNLSANCSFFLKNTLSYNGCVQRYRKGSDFSLNTWRIYLNAGGELWRNSHDVIRLLDAKGQVVDTITY